MNNIARYSSILLLSLLFLSSCGSKKTASEVTTQTGGTPAATDSYIKDSAYYLSLPKNSLPLTGGLPSDTLLIRAVLDNLEKNDTTRLKSYLMTQREFDSILFPELGLHWSGARDIRPETKIFLWENYRGGAEKGLRRVLRDLGGRKLKLKGFTYTDGSKKYISYTIHEGTEVTVIAEDGKEHKIAQIGSIVEKNGVCKLMSYRDRDTD